jgi:hypothetical protein
VTDLEARSGVYLTTYCCEEEIVSQHRSTVFLLLFGMTIIVGVSLVNAKTGYDYFVHAVDQLGAGLAGWQPRNALPAARAFAVGLIVTFFFLGLLGTYLLTRLWISAALARAEQTAFGTFTTPGVDERDLIMVARAGKLKQPDKQGLALHSTKQPAPYNGSKGPAASVPPWNKLFSLHRSLPRDICGVGA